MLEIRTPQLDPLADSPLVAFAERVCAYLLREQRALLRPIPEQRRVPVIARSLRAALGWGIETEWDLCRYVMLQLRVGPEFGTRNGPRWALEILDDEGNHGRGKIDALDHIYFNVLDAGVH